MDKTQITSKIFLPLVITALVLTIIPSKSDALSCRVKHGKELIENYPVIFKGKIVGKKPKKEKKEKNLFNRFFDREKPKPIVYSGLQESKGLTKVEVIEKIKGDVPNRVDVSSNNLFSLDIGEDIVLFTHPPRDDGVYVVGVCTPIYNILEIKKHENSTRKSYSNTLKEIKKFQSSKANLDKLIKEKGEAEYYLQKTLLLENYKDYEQAKRTYDDLFFKLSPIIHDKNISSPQESPEACTKPVENAPKLVKDMKPHITYDGLPDLREYVLSYGRLLFKLKDYRAALRPLCLAGNISEAINLQTQSLVKLGLKNKLNKQALNLANADLRDVDLSNLNIEHSNFSNSSFRKLNLNKSNLAGANFDNAELDKLEAISTSFNSASFVGSKIEGDMSNSNLSKIDAQNSHFEVNLANTNLSNSNLKGAKIKGSLIGANLKDANLEGAYIYALKGVKLQNTNLKGIQSTFKDFPKRGADYSEVDLSGLDLSGGYFLNTNFIGAKFNNTNLSKAKLTGSNLRDVNFNGANLTGANLTNKTDLRGANLRTAKLKHTKFNGAIYDCSTIFPDGFDPVNNLMENADKSCRKNETIKLPIESILEPPHKHWRLMDTDISKISKVIDFKNDLACGWGSWRHTGSMGKKSLKNKDLRNKDFSGCMLGYYDFTGAKLNNANFKGAYLYSANFLNADLKGANLDAARIADSTFGIEDSDRFKLIPTSVTNYQGGGVINGAGSPWQASRIKKNNRLRYTTKPVSVPIPNFPNEDLRGINFTAAWLPGSNMGGASLTLSDFTASNLMGANFESADMRGTVLFNSLLNNANFTNTNLYGADLRWARMSSANLERANLKNALYNENTIWPENFDPDKAGAFRLYSNENQ